MEIYNFKVSLIKRKIKLWREIEVLSNKPIAHLAYCILASVDASGSHLFNITYKNNRFEFIFDNMDMPEWIICHNPALYKLDELNLKKNDKMLMEYDYGVSWNFEICLLSISEAEKNSTIKYPRIISGKGRRLDEEGYFDYITSEDKKEIDVEIYSRLMRNEIKNYKQGYEQHLVNTKKLKLNFNENKNGKNVVDFETKKLWLSIPEEARNLYLTNAFCPTCSERHKDGIFKSNYSINLENGVLIIDGVCANCGNPIRRVCI